MHVSKRTEHLVNIMLTNNFKVPSVCLPAHEALGNCRHLPDGKHSQPTVMTVPCFPRQILIEISALRRGELLEVKWSNISEAGLVMVNHKNHNKEDALPLSDIARSVVERQPRLGEWVFCTESGKQLTTKNLNRDVRGLFDRLGFPKETRLHDLRGKFTTDLIAAGVDIKTTQTMARHTDATTTLKYYARTSEEAKIAALDSLKKKRGLEDGGVERGEHKPSQ